MARIVVQKAALSAASAGGAKDRALAWASGINIHRYPVHDLLSGRNVLVEARQALATTGVASFPGFLRPEVTAAAAAEAAEAAETAYECDSLHNAYQLPPDPDLPETHVRNMLMRTRVASTAFDELRGPLRTLYEYDGLVAFVGAILDRPLHRLADPLGSCSVNIFKPGWHHAWHYDESEFTTTLCLQQSEAGGGEFEFTPPLRACSSDFEFETTARVIREHSGYECSPDSGGASELPPIHTASFEPGTLQVFAGRYSLHRVKQIPAHSKRDRLVAVLCFASETQKYNSPEVQRMFWGRTA